MKKKKDTVLKTKRLVISPLSDEQLEKKMLAESDEHMKCAYGEMLDGCRKNPETRIWYTDWQIALRDGTVVGSIGFKGPADEFGEVEFGYGIDEEYRRKGYMTEACREMCDWAFSNAEVFFVTAETEPDNEASMGVLKKIDFKQYGMGEEGPRFEKERPASSWLVIYMLFGMSIGLSLGSLYGSTTLTMCIGLAIGISIGASLDASAKKKLSEKRDSRAAKNNTDDKNKQ